MNSEWIEDTKKLLAELEASNEPEDQKILGFFLINISNFYYEISKVLSDELINAHGNLHEDPNNFCFFVPLSIPSTKRQEKLYRKLRQSRLLAPLKA